MSHPKHPKSADRLLSCESIDLPVFQSVLDDLSDAESDQELLARYILWRDRAAIERLVVRHAPMVSAVCRATASCQSDAQDAFQATFLVLMQSAHKIRSHASLVAWLHGVAYRISTRTRSRRRREAAMVDSTQCDSLQTLSHLACEDPLSLLARKVELEWLFRELQQLPKKLMNALVEHYLYGYSTREISERMEISVSAVEGRLRRGRRLLRVRLMRHGISLTVALGALTLLKQQLLASEVQQWCSSFQVNYLAELDLVPQGRSAIGVDSKIQSLAYGELSMFKKTLLLKSAAGILAFGCIGTLVAFGYISGDGTQRNRRSTMPTVALRAGDTSDAVQATEQLPPVVLGQVGIVETQEPDSQQSSSPRPSAIAASTGGRPSPASPSRDSADPSKVENSKPVVWTRPEGERPAWLQSDESALSIEIRVEKHRQKLRHLTPSINYTDTPLSQVIRELAEHCQVAMTIDDAEIESVGVDRDAPTTIQLPECSLREALTMILTPLQLSYRIRESGIQITSSESTEVQGTLRCYDLSFLCVTSEHADSIMHSIQNSIEPDSWLEQGGSSSMSMVGSMLIIVCPDETHFEIENLLRMISKMNPGNSSPPKP